MKYCGTCDQHKPTDCFYNRAASPDGKASNCKECRKVVDKNRYERNKDKIQKANRERWRERRHLYVEAQKAWREKNRDRMNELDRERYFLNRDENMAKRREWYKKNRERALEEKKRYFQNNKKEITRKNWERIKSCPLRRLRHSVAGRTHLAIKNAGFKKKSTTAKILGCTWGDLKQHLEARMEPGMSWENYGEWHIDHITPLASAKSEEELIALCKYTNLQPLWAKDNLSKGARMPDEP